MRSVLTLLAAAALAAVPVGASAQLDLLDAGVYAAYANESFDGTAGVGGFLSADLPAFPVELRVTGERFFPDCGEDADGMELDGCALWGFGVDANLEVLPLPMVSPYLSGGFVYRYLDPSDVISGDEQTGAAVGGGVRLSLGGVGAFAEARYEFVEVPEEQVVIRAGIFF